MHGTTPWLIWTHIATVSNIPIEDDSGFLNRKGSVSD